MESARDILGLVDLTQTLERLDLIRERLDIVGVDMEHGLGQIERQPEFVVGIGISQHALDDRREDTLCLRLELIECRNILSL